MRHLEQFKLPGLMIIALLITLPFLQSCEDKENVRPDQFSDKTSSSDWENAAFRMHELPDPCQQVCLVAGQHMNVGTVDVAEVGGNLWVTYNLTETDLYLLEIHLDIFTSLEQLENDKKLKGGGLAPGKLEFKKEWDEGDMVTHYTVVIPEEYIEEVAGADAECVFIASHAALSNGETAWGGLCEESDKGVTLSPARQFPGANWSVYFEYCFDGCETVINFTYAWEDINEDLVDRYVNDADYNDLVVQSDVLKTATMLQIDFFASARGAAFDHAFKFRIPKAGILLNGSDPDIIGAANVTEDGDDYIVTVFESTKAELPAEGYSPYAFAANTAPADTDCTPTGEAQVTIYIDDATFDFDPDFPYDPFLNVKPGGGDPDYDLNIWELHQGDGTGDFWTRGGNDYPNGILIPDDWNWPLETVNVQLAYEDFSPIASWDEDWYLNLSDGTKVFTQCD